jgi:mRNA interferase MazF
VPWRGLRTRARFIAPCKRWRERLSKTQGREQAGRRPVLVVSVDAINRQPLVIAVVVGTDAKNVPREYPINVRLTAKETGLPVDTVFLCFQLRSLDPARFYDPKTRRPSLAGTVPPARMTEVDKALKLVLGL